MRGIREARAAWGGCRRAAAGQFIRFSVVGGINTVLDFGVYLGLTRGLSFFRTHFLAAAATSFSLAVLSSFLLNTFWTFRAGGDGWHRRAPRFFAVALTGAGLNLIILYGLVVGGLYDVAAKLVATAVVLVWNFTAQRRWTFKVGSGG